MLNFIGKALAKTPPVFTPVAGTRSFNQLYGQIFSWALWAGGAIAVIYLIYGGIMYITAGGDQEKATQARTAIVNSIIGIVIIALALLIVQWATTLATNVTAG